MINDKQALVEGLPKCDFCNCDARYDAKTLKGPWANMCLRHFGIYGYGELGLGIGQVLVL